MGRDRLYSITIKQLRVFAAVAQERSFVRAADTLYLASPTISGEIKTLENTVGQVLLRRSRGCKQIEVTEAGEILLDTYNEFSRLLTKAEQALDSIKRVEKGTVTFGADIIFGGYLLPLVHNTFCRDHQGISLRVEVDNRLRILEGITQGKLDIAVLLGAEEETGIVHEPLITCCMVPVGPAGHRMAGPRPTPFRDFVRENLILGDRSAFIRRRLDRMAAEMGTTLNVVLEVAGVDAPQQAVLGGLGVTVLGACCVEAEVSAGRLSILQVEGFPVKMEWSIVHNQTQLSPSAMALKNHLLRSRGVLKSALPSDPSAVSVIGQ